MTNIQFNGKKLTFDVVYYFSPMGDDLNGDGTELSPFKTPTGAISHGVLLRNEHRNIGFILDSGIYSLNDKWFDSKGSQIVDALNLTILSFYPERTIIKTNKLLHLDYFGALSANITITNITIDWDNIQYDGLVNFASSTLPITAIRFSNVLLNIGKVLESYMWFFSSGNTQQGTVIFENCVVNTMNSYILNSLNPSPIIFRGVTLRNTLVHQNIQIETAPTVINQQSCLVVPSILQSYLRFPLNQVISHKGLSTILNPDGGISHIGVCGGENAWHFDTYWYKFSYVDEIFDKIPLEQVKQHYKLQHYFPGESLYEQVRSLEEEVNTSGNKVLNYVLNSINTYNILDFIESPHTLHYTVDESLLGNYDVDDVHKVLLDIMTPISNNTHLFIYKNGILLKEFLQYELKNHNQVLLYSLNLGDEVYLYIGWENYLNSIHINYKINEDGTESNKIENIVCENISVKSQYNYDVNNRLISQTLLTKDNVSETRDYSYDKMGRLSNIIIR